VQHQVGAQRQRLHQPRGGERAVEQQRQAGVVRDLRHGGHVEHVQPRVAQRLAKQQPGVGAHGGAPAIEVGRCHEGGFDAKAAQRVLQQVVAAAVERARGHQMPPGARQGGHRQMQRRLSAGGGNGPDAAFERGHALLEHGVGRVADAAIDVTGALEVEQRRRVVARLEHERGAQVDRQRAGTGAGVGGGAGVQGQGVETGVGGAAHGGLSSGRVCGG